MDDTETLKKRLTNIGKNTITKGLNEKEVNDTLQKTKFVERLKFVLNEGKVTELKREIGNNYIYCSRSCSSIYC